MFVIFSFAIIGFTSSQDAEKYFFKPIAVMNDLKTFDSINEKYTLLVQEENGTEKAILINNESNNKINLELPPVESINFAKFFTDSEILVISAGGLSVFEQKFLIGYNFKTGNLVWRLPLQNDFFISDIMEKGDILPIGLHNNGVLLIINVKGSILLNKKIFDKIYFTGITEDNLIVAFGTDDYKSSIFKIKILNLQGDLIKEIDGFHEDDRFSISPMGPYIINYSSNSFFNKSEEITVINFETSSTESSIKPKFRPRHAIFSSDGKYIFCISGYKSGSVFEVFDVKGKLVDTYNIDTNETFVQPKSIFEKKNHIEIILQKDEM